MFQSKRKCPNDGHRLLGLLGIKKEQRGTGFGVKDAFHYLNKSCYYWTLINGCTKHKVPFSKREIHYFILGTFCAILTLIDWAILPAPSKLFCLLGRAQGLFAARDTLPLRKWRHINFRWKSI